VDLSKTSAQIHDAIYVENCGGRPQKLTVTAYLTAPDGSDAGSKARSLTLTAGAKQSVEFVFDLANVQLWDLDHANLYSIRSSVSDSANRLLDEKSDSFGNRKIEIRDRHLFLNGQHVRLSGMTRHEESPWEGLAETAGTIKHDYDDLKLLHTTLTRPVHYPQHEEVLEYADTHGILLTPAL